MTSARVTSGVATRGSDTERTQGHDACSHSDLEDRSLARGKTSLYVRGVVLAPSFASAGLVVVFGELIEFGHQEMLSLPAPLCQGTFIVP